MTAIYNASGKIERIEHPGYGFVYYTYDADGLLTQQDYDLGFHLRYTFAYNNGVIDTISYYNNVNPGGTFALWRYYTYTVAGGNVTIIKEYDKDGTLVGELTLTYSTLPNIFKDLAYFNYGNIMGLNYFMSFEGFLIRIWCPPFPVMVPISPSPMLQIAVNSPEKW